MEYAEAGMWEMYRSHVKSAYGVAQSKYPYWLIGHLAYNCVPHERDEGLREHEQTLAHSLSAVRLKPIAVQS